MLADPVVEHALAADRAALLRIEGGRVILEILAERTRLRTLVEDLGLAFVDLAATGHRRRGLRTNMRRAAAIGEPSRVRN